MLPGLCDLELGDFKKMSFGRAILKVINGTETGNELRETRIEDGVFRIVGRLFTV